MNKAYTHTMSTLLAEWKNRQGGGLDQKFALLRNRPFEDPSDAERLCEALDHPRGDELDAEAEPIVPELHDPAWYTIAWEFTGAESDAVRNVIRRNGLPKLKKRLDQALSETAVWKSIDEEGDSEPRYLNGKPVHYLGLLSVLAYYHDPDAAKLAATTSRHHRFQDAVGWPDSWRAVFDRFSGEISQASELLELLREPLPLGQAAQGYLIFANRLQQDGIHPFDSREGLQRLLKMVDEEEDDLKIEDPTALFIVETLPYLSGSGVEELRSKLAKLRNKFVRRALRRDLFRRWFRPSGRSDD